MSRKRNLDNEVNQRRHLIFRRVVLENRPLRLSALQTLLNDKSYNEQKALRDVEDFKAVGCLIELQPCAENSEEKHFVFTEGPHTDDDTWRERINGKGKELAARMAATIICGPSECIKKHLLPTWMKNSDIDRALQESIGNAAVDREITAKVRSVLLHLQEMVEFENGDQPIGSTDTIVKLLNQSTLAVGDRLKSLRLNLRKFWAEANRMVAIDSGTTNKMLARYLKELSFPLPGSPLCALSVCTNSRKIFEELGPPEVGVKCIIVGGQQKFRSPTVAGAMAELFLRTASILQFGLCILGSTKVDVERFAICSDSQEEASMKNLFMEKSSLRIVCVDDSKLQTGPGREGYKYASIDPNHIDLIITNSPFRTKNQNSSKADIEKFKSFRTKVLAIEGRGVPVLVATSEETFGHPNEEEVPSENFRKKSTRASNTKPN